jgi:glycosyltransferase involved in cell wall biosynthesis
VSQEEPAVDIGLPCFRRATYLAEAIDSVLAQTFERWRLTVVDNGGSAEIAAVVASYLGDDRIAYAPSNEVPLAENWTRALGHGDAAYVAILNDDDTWLPGFLQHRVDALEAHAECGFAFGACFYLDHEGSRPSDPFAPEGVVSRETLARTFTERNPVAPSAVVVRRASLDRVGTAFDGRWHYCDWEMWSRLAASAPAYFVQTPDNVFRRHAATNTFAGHETPRQLMAMVDHLEGLFEQEPGVGLRRSRRERRRSRALILLRAAADVHSGGGWKVSRQLYTSALRTYPPVVLQRASVAMVAKSLLGERLSRVVAEGLRTLSRVGDRSSSGVR